MREELPTKLILVSSLRDRHFSFTTMLRDRLKDIILCLRFNLKTERPERSKTDLSSHWHCILEDFHSKKLCMLQTWIKSNNYENCCNLYLVYLQPAR